MDIMFEVVSRQKLSATFPTTHVFGEAGGYIGRSEDCEWMLPDRSKHISRKHALITFEDGQFYLEDVSSNGVYLSLGHERVGKSNRHKIEHGEGFVIGEFTIMSRLLHNPEAYASSGPATGQDILNFSEKLSLNPIQAMDQEEELIARRRLGDFDNLIGRPKAQAMHTSDHTDPRLSTMHPVNPIPEQDDIIPEDWDADPESELAVRNALPTQPPVAPVAPTREVAVTVPETDMFFKALGFAEAPLSQDERTRILELAAQLLVTATNGMTYAMQHRNSCKQELRLPVTSTGFGISNNPLKFSPTAEAALATLLGPPQKGVLPPVEAMRQGFEDLHRHHMGLLAGARAAVRAILEKVSPQAVENRLDMNGPVRLNRTGRLWHTFMRMHQSLKDDHDGLSAFFLEDFARAYEVQGRTLRPLSNRDSQGVRP